MVGFGDGTAKTFGVEKQPFLFKTKAIAMIKRLLDKYYRWSTFSSKKEFSDIPEFVVKTLDSDMAVQTRATRFLPSRSTLDTSGRKVHGMCELPEGYALSIVSSRTVIHEIGECQKNDEAQLDKDQVGSGEDRASASSSNTDEEGDHEQIEDTQDNDMQGRGCEKRLRRILRHRFSTPGLEPFETDLSAGYSFSKALVAIFQTIYASATLYRARGDQISRYGYAAFGLTVAPYLVMSLINLISNLLTPEYPALYMVKNDVMIEASRRLGSKFEGVVGTVQSERTVVDSSGKVEWIIAKNGSISVKIDGSWVTNILPRTPKKTKKYHYRRKIVRQTPIERPIMMIPSCSEYKSTVQGANQFLSSTVPCYAATGVSLVSIAIVGALSHFNPGESTHAQRVWTMTWLVFGIAFSSLSLTMDSGGFLERLGSTIYGAASFGGFVVVGQMLRDYGHCIRLS